VETSQIGIYAVSRFSRTRFPGHLQGAGKMKFDHLDKT